MDWLFLGTLQGPPKEWFLGRALRPQSEGWPAPVRVLIPTPSIPLGPQSLVSHVCEESGDPVPGLCGD